MVDVTLSHNLPLYAGINLTLTCTVTVDHNVDHCEKIITKWSGLQDIPEERYSVTAASTYTGSLTISPLAYRDTGTYTCTGTVIGVMSYHQVTASDNITISVNSKLYSQPIYTLHQYFNTLLLYIYSSFQCYKTFHFTDSHVGTSINCVYLHHILLQH